MNIVQTGDTSNTMLYGLLLVAAIVVVIVLLIGYLRRKNKK